MIVRTILGSIAVFCCGVAGAQLAEPVHVRNLNPLVAVFGLPAWDIVPIGTKFGVTGEVANHYRFSLAGNERLMLDGETVRTTLSFDARIRERLVARRRRAVLPRQRRCARRRHRRLALGVRPARRWAECATRGSAAVRLRAPRSRRRSR